MCHVRRIIHWDWFRHRYYLPPPPPIPYVMPNTRWLTSCRKPVGNQGVKGQIVTLATGDGEGWGGASSVRQFSNILPPNRPTWMFFWFCRWAAAFTLLKDVVVFVVVCFFVLFFLLFFQKPAGEVLCLCSDWLPCTTQFGKFCCHEKKKSKKQSAAPVRLAVLFSFICDHNFLIVILHRGRKTTKLDDCYFLSFFLQALGCAAVSR